MKAEQSSARRPDTTPHIFEDGAVAAVATTAPSNVIDLFPSMTGHSKAMTDNSDPVCSLPEDMGPGERAVTRQQTHHRRMARQRVAERRGAGRVFLRDRWPAAGSELGMATAEYAIATLAAVGFAGLLVVILRSDAVRGLLMGLIQQALSFG